MKIGFPVIATWISVLSDSGLLHGEREEEGILAATQIVGERRLSDLRWWLTQQPPELVRRQRTAAIELCIWMAVVDRVIDAEERELLKAVIQSADLPPHEEHRLYELLGAALGDLRKLTHVETLAEVLDHQTLRELMLAMTWHVAMIDGFIDKLEEESYERLAAIFSVDYVDAIRIRETLMLGSGL